MKKIYLPKLDEIHIVNYSLYFKEPSFSFKFKDGISAIVGANGIGKTTFVNILIYCLVGHKRIRDKKLKKKNGEYIDIDFFSSRINEKYEKNEEAEAYLSFTINDINIKIGRSLIENEIVLFQVNGINKDKISNNEYEDYITNVSGINSFEDFEKIIRNFLFFDELRANIAWQADMQDDILRILLFDNEYFTKFKELEQAVTEWDSKGRHKSEEKRMAIKALKNLVDEKNQVINQLNYDAELKRNETDSEEKKLDQLFESKNRLSEEIKGLQSSINDQVINVKSQRNILNTLIGERDNISLKIDKISDQISKLESALFSGVLEKLPGYYYTIEKSLITTGECLVCNAKSKDIKASAIKRSNEKKCLICDSPLNYEEEIDPKIIENINELNEKKDEMVVVYNNKCNKIDKLEEEIYKYENRIKQVEDIINTKKRELIYIESLITEKNAQEKTDTYTEIVKSRQNTISELDVQIDKAYRKRDELKKELASLNNKFKNTITKLNSSLSGYFNKYASTFIGLECELTISERIINKVPHFVYLPRIDGVIRKNIWAVSESQRFFLDQAFRMAIIDYLQNTIEGFKTYFITETPEGSLDIAYESQVANMFIKFSRSNNNIIFTSNLNSSNFLSELFTQIDTLDRSERILNLIEKGNLTKVQMDNIPKLERILSEILRGEG